MTLFNECIKDIDFEISELNQQIKKLELEQKKMKERNAEVDKALKILGKVVEDYSNCKRELAVTCYDIGETAYGDEFLEKIKRWDFSLSPDENRDREREPEPTPEPEPAGDDNDAEFLTENMAQNSSQPFQIPPKTKEEAEPNDVSFQFQSQGKGVWLVFVIANGEKTQLAGVMQVGSFYRVPNLNNADFGTLESAAKALWEHHQQRQKVFTNF
ncbi:hypothetical protein [Limnoraphis robusta]|uniref:Uncharacterized protein n=1 Tax=Limnoraphis robusta CCNP1315 TaxID=3110306 RepID=A0ABU5U2H6_9CYAN|nr:hypothetical protein [Limnoraphis robusta]MEA5521390.1 hypothetical protein [Limnoraphis robusta CCNP1315]MEA5547933.1 hypothetical protein [Limnoraphis robusta CCNP1324]